MVRITYTLAVLGILNTFAAQSQAAPAVQFDVGYLRPAEDVSTDQFYHARPGYQMMQLELLISTMVDSRYSEELTETTFIVEPRNPRIQIEDFSPQTTLQSPYASNISKENRVEVDLSGKLAMGHRVDPSLGGDAAVTSSRRSASIEKFDILPELNLVSASGTLHRGRSVYFRFNRTSQNSLEGTTRIGLVLAVPQGWTADMLTVRCTAKLRQPVVPGGPSRETKLPESTFTVAVYRMGDHRAAKIAAQYVQAETEWQQVKRKYADAIKAGRRDSPLDYLTSIVRLDSKEGSIEQWLRNSPREASRQLPSAVVDAYYRLRQAKSELDQLSGIVPSGRNRPPAPIANTPLAVAAGD